MTVVVPPIDVDLVWHTHILRRGVQQYLDEARAWCGGKLLDHDDNILNLDELWNTTQAAWEQDDTPSDQSSLVLRNAVRAGANHRGDPPPLWHNADTPIVVVEDNFLSEEEISQIMAQMPSPDEAVVGGGGAAHGRGFGKDARTSVNVNSNLERRIKSCVSQKLGMPVPIVHTQPTSSMQGKLPARVAVGHMGAHRDRVATTVNGKPTLGPYADGYVAVVYLKGGGGLRLQCDGSAGWIPSHAREKLHQLEISVKAGRLVAWPNFAVVHSGQPSAVTDSDQSQSSRWILGPVALIPGRTRLAQSEDCGGGVAVVEVQERRHQIHPRTAHSLRKSTRASSPRGVSPTAARHGPR